MDDCLPYIFPLRSVRDECTVPYAQLGYEYEGLEEHWLAPVRELVAAAKKAASNSTLALARHIRRS